MLDPVTAVVLLIVAVLAALAGVVASIVCEEIVRRRARKGPPRDGPHRDGGEAQHSDESSPLLQDDEAVPPEVFVEPASPAAAGGAAGPLPTQESAAVAVAPAVTLHLSPAAARRARQQFIAAARPAQASQLLAEFGERNQEEGLLLFYNVHGFCDPFGLERAREIAALVSRAAAAGASVIALAEAAPDEAASRVLARYPRRLTVDNGGTRLAVAWRDPRATAVAIPTTGSRTCILYTVSHSGPSHSGPSHSGPPLRVMFVHLEIGARPRPDGDGSPGTAAHNRAVRAANAAERVRQLQALVAHGPDILVGDFNFEPGSPEEAWLTAAGYRLASGTAPSTPFNRVDHCYVKEDANGAALCAGVAHPVCALLPVAYSDHRPLLVQLNAKNARGTTLNTRA